MAAILPPSSRWRQLEPSDSAVRIRLGLRAESQHDFTRAERYLLEAAQIDKLFSAR